MLKKIYILAVPQQQLIDTYALRNPLLYNIAPHLQTSLTSLDANTLLQEQLSKLLICMAI